MRRVTRNVDLKAARDLLERVPRACIAVAGDDGPQALPITLVWREERYLAGLPEDATGGLGPRQEAVLLVDEGLYFFDLRATYIRGPMGPADAPVGAPAGHWHTFESSGSDAGITPRVRRRAGPA